MRFTIFGSCVTRDAFSLRGHDALVHDYYARSSIASVVSAPLGIKPEALNLRSAFQRRVVARDLNKDFMDGEWLAGTDYLIIDLIDDRYGIAQVVGRDACYLTLSGDLANSGLQETLPCRNLTQTEKEALYPAAVARFAELINPLASRGRVILHAAYLTRRVLERGWETDFEDEAYVPPGSIDRQNAILKRYYHLLRGACPQMGLIDLTCGPAHIADANHRWGRSPFHYADCYSDAFMDELGALVGAPLRQPE